KEAATVGGEQEKLVGALGLEDEALLVALLVLDVGGVLDMPAHAPDPALGGEQDGDRKTLDGRIQMLGIDHGRLAERGAPVAKLARPELRGGLEHLRAEPGAPLRLRAEKRLELLLLLSQRLLLLPELHLLEPTEIAQAQVENCLGLALGQLERLDELHLG